MQLQPGDTILFQGDSITDWYRGRDDPTNLGRGYVFMVASRLLAFYPEMDLTLHNRGVSGHTCADLAERWQRDCLDLKPTWLSLYIGINDCWNRYRDGRHPPVDAKEFEHAYRNLLSQTTTQLDCRLILMEPFVLPVQEDQPQWREDLNPKIDVVRSLAREFDALLVPLDGLFAAASTRKPPAYWAEDGVHPTPAGHALIAEAWLEAIGA